MANKIKYGLKNVYYAKITANTSGEVYSAPVPIPGAVNLSLAAEGSNDPFYADDVIYHNVISNNGYSGVLEVALIPDSFRKDILGEAEDDNGILVEKSDVPTNYFALLFEFDGDASAKRFAMYKCSATRPDVASQTKEATATPQTETLNISCIANANGYVKGKAEYSATSGSAYQSWFTTVQEPEFTPTP